MYIVSISEGFEAEPLTRPGMDDGHRGGSPHDSSVGIRSYMTFGLSTCFGFASEQLLELTNAQQNLIKWNISIENYVGNFLVEQLYDIHSSLCPRVFL